MRPAFASKMGEGASLIQESLGAVYTAFMKQRTTPLAEVEKNNLKIDALVKDLTATLLSEKDSDLEATTHWLSIVNSLDKARDSVIKAASIVREKAEDGVLFSEKAVVETRTLFDELSSLLGHYHDILITGNNVIIEYMVQRLVSIRETMRRYATEHEERLIKGICLPKPSTLYLALMDAFKDLTWILTGCIRQYQSLK